MQLMARYPDNYFDLAIVDPPYGINFGNYNRTKKDAMGLRHKKKDWDTSVPTSEYFIELKRVSKHQIVFGGNYFLVLAGVETPNLKKLEDFNQYMACSSQKWLFWDKQNPVPNFADGELAWLSPELTQENWQFDFKYYGNLQGNTSADNKIHPTQKPYQLYKFCLHTFARPGFKILDTHLGSGSIATACHDYDFELTACELDKDYFKKTIRRLSDHVIQGKLF